MNRPESSKYVPGLPADDDIDTPTNVPVDDSIKIYDGVAECTMNDVDTLKSVKLRAKDLAIQKVQQKIADYVYGFWKDRYLTLPDDEVLSIANEICNITDVKYNVLDSDDNTLVRATVLSQVDDNVLMNYIIQFFKERNELKIQNETLRKENEALSKEIADLKQQQDKTIRALENQNESLRNENSDLKHQIEDLRRQRDSVTREKSALENQNRDFKSRIADLKQQQDKTTRNIENQNETLHSKNLALLNEIEDLKRQIDSVASEKSALENQNKDLRRQIIELQQQIIRKDKIDLAKKKYDDAFNTYWREDYRGAIKLYDEVIQLNPYMYQAYNIRGKCYKALGEESKAQADFKKAEELRKKGW